MAPPARKPRPHVRIREYALTASSHCSPRLLVSVRNPGEARIARDAGTDLIDLKEPRRGSLGMVDMPVAEAVADELPAEALSLALGELTEWNGSPVIPKVPSAIRFLKLGLSNQADHPDWKQDWPRLRQAVNERSGKSFDWIAVVYADCEAARSPAPEEIIAAARESNCTGVLFDTWSKTGGSLTDHLSLENLASYIASIHSAGMLAALAGGVRAEHLPELLPLEADIIAVRGAVCEHQSRTARVRSESIAAFRRRLNGATKPIGR